MLLSDTNTLLSSHKANPVAHSTFWFNFRHARISSDWCMLLRRHYTECHTHKNMLHVSLWCCCAYKILCNRGQVAANSRLLFPEWGGIRSHISRRVLDFSEVLIQLLNHQKELEAKLCSYCCATAGWHNIAVWFSPDFSFSFFSFVIVLVFVFVFVTKIALTPCTPYNQNVVCQQICGQNGPSPKDRCRQIRQVVQKKVTKAISSLLHGTVLQWRKYFRAARLGIFMFTLY